MRRNKRNNHGVNLAEFAASVTFGAPILVLLVFVALECAHFYTIKSAMEVAARTAARTLVVQYNLTGVENDNSAITITMPNFVASSNQFAVTWDSATPPAYCTVTCTYPSAGGNGLKPFPAGPLRYLTHNAVFSMGNVSVQGTFTLPVQ